MKFEIFPVNDTLKDKVQAKINAKTKPLGALGMLEDVALKICLIQNTLEPSLSKPTIVLFAGDHGIAKEGVSLYPQEVTYQMVYNFLSGGAAINAFCKQNKIELLVADAGVNHDFPKTTKLIHTKVAKGTCNFLNEKAMSKTHCMEAIENGAAIVKNLYREGSNIIGFGEMGIGNTASAAALMSVLTQYPIHECTGKGTGLNDMQTDHKINILQKAIAFHSNIHHDPFEVLQTFGGFEIAMMCGAMMQAAENKIILMIDGFIATAALLVACKIYPSIVDYCIFCHQSMEKGHKKLLEYLNASPLLSLNMRLGEGTGAAVAFPIIQSSVTFFNEMASFESAEVSSSVKP